MFSKSQFKDSRSKILFSRISQITRQWNSCEFLPWILGGEFEFQKIKVVLEESSWRNSEAWIPDPALIPNSWTASWKLICLSTSYFLPSRKKGVGPLGLPWRRAAWLPPTVLVGFSEVWEGQIPGGEQSSRVIRSCSICHLLQHHSPDNPVTKHRAQDGPQGGLEEFMPLAGQLPLTRLIWKGWGMREE